MRKKYDDLTSSDDKKTSEIIEVSKEEIEEIENMVKLNKINFQGKFFT
jgi:hypothetical protein